MSRSTLAVRLLCVPDDVEGTSVLTDGLLDALYDDPFAVLLDGYRT